MPARTQQITHALYWEVAAILWMIVEAILSLEAGYQAHSLALTGFGMDSLIELVSAGILVWRLRIEARGADDLTVDRVETLALGPSPFIISPRSSRWASLAVRPSDNCPHVLSESREGVL